MMISSGFRAVLSVTLGQDTASFVNLSPELFVYCKSLVKHKQLFSVDDTILNTLIQEKILQKAGRCRNFVKKMHDKMGFVNGRTIDLDFKCDPTNLCL